MDARAPRRRPPTNCRPVFWRRSPRVDAGGGAGHSAHGLSAELLCQPYRDFAAAVGAAFSIVRLIDIVFDPLIGVAINATNTRFGRFRPWMVAGAPLLMLAAYMIFMAEPGVDLALSRRLAARALRRLFDADARPFVLGRGAGAGVSPAQPRLWLDAGGRRDRHRHRCSPLPVDHRRPAGTNRLPQGVQAMGWFIIGDHARHHSALHLRGRRTEAGRDARSASRCTDYWTMIARPSLLRILAPICSWRSARPSRRRSTSSSSRRRSGFTPNADDRRCC